MKLIQKLFKLLINLRLSKAYSCIRRKCKFVETSLFREFHMFGLNLEGNQVEYRKIFFSFFIKLEDTPYNTSIQGLTIC